MGIGNEVSKFFDDIVITIIIGVGLIGGTLLLLFDFEPIAVSLFFAAALTGFTYRFLGGIDAQTSFTLGALKLSGTAAVLIGSMWLIDARLIEETRTVPTGALPAGLTPGEVFLFDADGEPVAIGDPADTSDIDFPLPKRDLYKDRAARRLVSEKNKIYIVARRDSIYLGYVDEDPERLGLMLQTPEQALSLGLYYSQYDSSGSRRNPEKAIACLSSVLQRDNSSVQARKDAVRQLFFLQDYFTQPEEFELLLEMIAKWRDNYYIIYLELAETHLNYANKIAANEEREKLSALYNYLKYLSTPQSAGNNKFTRQQRKRVQKYIDELVTNGLVQNQDIQHKRADLLKAVKDHNRTRLTLLSDEIAAELLAEK